MHIAASAYNSLPSIGLKPDSVTYTSMMHVILNLMDDSTEKAKAIEGIFRRCCEEGCLNRHILKVLAEALSKEELFSIAGKDMASFSSLPGEWSRNSSQDTNIV